MDSLEPEQLAKYIVNRDLFRHYAEKDPVEHAGFLLMSPDGAAQWTDSKVMKSVTVGTSETAVGQLVAIEDISDEMVEAIRDGATLVHVHDHPTAIVNAPGGPERITDVPPSPTDMSLILGILDRTGVEATTRVEGRVVAEVGEWRFGFKSAKAVAKLNEAFVVGNEDLRQLSSPKLLLQSEIFTHLFLEKIIKNSDASSDAADILATLVADPNEFIADIQSSSKLFAIVSGYLEMNMTKEEIAESGIEEFASIIQGVTDKKNKALEAIHFMAPTITNLLIMPPMVDDKDSEEYRQRWQSVGAYIDKVPVFDY
jgi:hypothetical protein